MNYISLVIWGGTSQNIFPIFICCRFELAMRGRAISWWWAASFSTRRWRWRCSRSSLPNADFGYFQPSVYCRCWSLWNEVGFRLLIILKQICFVMHFNFNTGLWSSWKLTPIWCIMYSISNTGLWSCWKLKPIWCIIYSISNTGLWSCWKLTPIWCIMYSISNTGLWSSWKLTPIWCIM